MPVFDDDRAGGLKAEGCEQVIGWEDGHGQVDIRVVRLSDRVAGVRRAPDRPGRAG